MTTWWRVHRISLNLPTNQLSKVIPFLQIFGNKWIPALAKTDRP